MHRVPETISIHLSKINVQYEQCKTGVNTTICSFLSHYLLVRAVTVFVLVSLTTFNSHVLGMRAVPFWFESAIQNVFNLIVQIINLVVGTVELNW